MRQIHEDGVTAEQAFGYVPFVWELFLIPFAAAEAAGRSVSPAVKERLRASLEFARAIRLPDGRWPQVGDEDDGRVLLAHDDESRLDRVGNALAAWLGADALCEGESVYARMLFGRAPAAPRAAADGTHEFPRRLHGVARARAARHVRSRSAGLGALAAHGHADALAITVFHGADPIVVDPGTFAYHEDTAARDACRSTPAHATVSFGARSQSEMLGPFLWGRRARVTPRGEEHECAWATGELHARRVAVEGGCIAIHDHVRGEFAALLFPLAPGAKVELDGARATVTIGGSRARFDVEGGAPWQLIPGEHARALRAPRAFHAAHGGDRGRRVPHENRDRVDTGRLPH
jgi:hypothetical protein